MALERLKGPATRWTVFHPEAIADIENVTADELNAAIDAGLGFNITCAVNQDGSNFDLGDSDTDDSLTFCEIAGAQNPTEHNPDITIEVETSRDRVEENTANTAHNLFAYRGRTYYFGLSVGVEPDSEFEPGERVKLSLGETDYGTYQIGSGENQRLSVAVANRGEIAWNRELV